MASEQSFKRSSRSCRSHALAKTPYRKPPVIPKSDQRSRESQTCTSQASGVARSPRSPSTKDVGGGATWTCDTEKNESELWVDTLLRNGVYAGYTREQIVEATKTQYGSEEAAEEAHRDAILYCRYGKQSDRLNIADKPTDKETVDYFEVSSSVHIRMWLGNVGDLGSCCLDFVDEKHKEIFSPAGYKIYFAPYGPRDELLSGEAKWVAGGGRLVGPLNPTDTYFPDQDELMCVQVPSGGRKFFRTLVGPVEHPYTLLFP